VQIFTRGHLPTRGSLTARVPNQIPMSLSVANQPAKRRIKIVSEFFLPQIRSTKKYVFLRSEKLTNVGVERVISQNGWHTNDLRHWRSRMSRLVNASRCLFIPVVLLIAAAAFAPG
jgi:hypothetical protein